MPLFVDSVGLNTLVSSSFDGNTLSSGINPSITSISDEDYLVGINIHRNGLYGFSCWKQLRVSENPITRHHKSNSTMTFVIQPGPTRNILANGEFRVKDRYSKIHSFKEPAIAQKAYPLVWNVGRHFKDENGNVDLERPEKFSIISSYANQGIGFANERVDRLLKYDPDEEKSEYREIYKLYAEGGLNDQKSPITYWEFLQYRETVFPHMKNQFQNENLERPNFVSFYRHNRADRTTIRHNRGFRESAGTSTLNDISQSTWVLDEHQDFLTRTYNSFSGSVFWFRKTAINSFPNRQDLSFQNRDGEGALMNTYTQFHHSASTWGNYLNGGGSLSSAIIGMNNSMYAHPLYSRRISLNDRRSLVNPTGIELQYITAHTAALFQGGALWEAGSTRQIKDADGNYVSAPKTPFYDTYEAYVEEARRRYKNFSVVPEFRISTRIEDYITNNGAIELDMFDVTGGAENAQNSSQSQFYEIYSNSDFMRQFELINEDHKEFTNGKVLSLRCKAVKKFLPYEGFYPAQRSVELSKQFHKSYRDNITAYNLSGEQELLSSQGETLHFKDQYIMNPLFAPGVLFNTIKSGVAVDYPVRVNQVFNYIKETDSRHDEWLLSGNEFDARIPFEAIVEPNKYLSNLNLSSQEPHPSGNFSSSATWDGNGDELYVKMANNFTAEIPEFFLSNGNFTSLSSKKQKDIGVLEQGKVYGMRLKMARSMNKPPILVHHSGQSSLPYKTPQDIIVTDENLRVRETLTMYSRPSAFGPPTRGENQFNTSSAEIFRFSEEGIEFQNAKSSNRDALHMSSTQGFNFPFTPPYYHGEGWCHITITGSGEKLTIEQIQNSASYEFTRFDFTHMTSSGATYASYGGPQSFYTINKNAVQLSASLNIKGLGSSRKKGEDNLVVDTALDENNRWIIQTKFETPVLNFNHYGEGGESVSLPVYGSESVPRGMWHQYGRIPSETEGIYISVEKIPENYQTVVMKKSEVMEDLSEFLGFSNDSVKIGNLRPSKTIYEAVVAVPFIEQEGRKKFFSLDPNMVKAYKDGGEARDSLTTGDPQNQIGRSVLNQLQKMEKYIFPPSFDFLNNSIDEVKPIAMYIFEFSHTLNQQDLADIWQNLPPDIGTEMEESEVAITHPLLKKELLGEGGESGNTLIDMPNKLRWMVFKVKQRAASNYFKKTVLRNPEVNTEVENSNVTVDEFGNTSTIQYNWPYDFFSLVELVKIDAEVEFGNFKDEDIANYTDSIPAYEAQNADVEKISEIVGGMEDDIVPDIEPPPTMTPVMSTEVFAGQNVLSTPQDTIETPSLGGLSSAPSGLGASPQIDKLEELKNDARTIFAGKLRQALPDGKKLADLGQNRALRIVRRSRRRTRRDMNNYYNLYPELKEYINTINAFTVFANEVGGVQSL